MAVQPNALLEAIEAWTNAVKQGFRCTDDGCKVDSRECTKGLDKFCLASDAITQWCDLNGRSELAKPVEGFKQLILKRFRGRMVTDDELADTHDLAAGSIDRIKALLAVTPTIEQSTPAAKSPRRYLTTWREILNALDMLFNKQSKDDVRKLNREFAGPINMPSQGGQPKVDKGDLQEWWAGLRDRFRRQQEHQENAKATVADQHEYSRDGMVVPGISGSVRQRRGKPKS